jgi:hypothetical protein
MPELFHGFIFFFFQLMADNAKAKQKHTQEAQSDNEAAIEIACNERNDCQDCNYSHTIN